VIDKANIAKLEEQNSPDFAEFRIRYRSTQIWAAAFASACLWLAILMPLIGIAENYSSFYWFSFWHQDLLFTFLFLLIPALLMRKNKPPTSASWMEFFATPRGLCVATACLVGICWVGRHFVYLDYNLSRDEQMADFDAYIFAHGKLFWPLPNFWQAHAQALNQLFILPIGNHEAWVSAYLPIHAALRAAVGLLVPSSLTSPALVAMGTVSLWRIAKRLWPNSPSTRSVALILYAGSAQVVANGMTTYAMNGHLALDLVWLDLFLLNRRWSHLGAIIIGFLATGLHQPIFHPLFVLPFLGLLGSQRRWRTLAFYSTAYFLICAFWFAWPIWISSHGMGHVGPHGADAPNFLLRAVHAFYPPGAEAIWLTALDLLRFVTWQHLLFFPLLAVGMRATWNHDPLGRAIAISFLLPIPVMLILLPFQGHGWGYRYLHGVIGNGCLLACYGWAALESQGLAPRRALAWTTAVTFLIIMPIRGAMVHQMVAPFASVSRAIDTSPAGFAIVDNSAAPFGGNLVINQPDLSNRPIRLMASELRASDIPDICARGTIAFIKAPILKPTADFFGESQEPLSPHVSRLEVVAKDSHCSFVRTPKLVE
jgi:hypothetical protein